MNLVFLLVIKYELRYVCVSRTPLHYAAANCNYQCLFALVGSGASVNDLDERGCTPLHYAAASDTDGKYVFHVSSVIKEGCIKTGYVCEDRFLHYSFLLWQVPGIFTEK